MHPSPALTRSRPRQARSEVSLQRLLDAAQAIIEERGHQDLSITEVARRAGSSVGGFYARFENKDELLSALETSFLHKLSLLLDELAAPERWRHASDVEVIRGLIAVVVENHRRHGKLILAFVGRAVRDAEHRQELVAFRRRVGERLAALALTRKGRIAHPNPVLAVDFAMQAVTGILQSRVVLGGVESTDHVLPFDVLATELERLVCAYLGIGESHDH